MPDRRKNNVSRALALALAAWLCVPSLASAAEPTGSPIGECAPQAEGAVDQLPDARMDELYGLTIRTTAAGSKRLRFGTAAWNVGEGPLEVRGDQRSGATMTRVAQRIYDDQGGCRDILQPLASMFRAGDGHNHWHVSKYIVTHLYLKSGGSALRVRKTGFCLLDVNRGTDLPRNTPPDRVYWNGACGDKESQSIAMGISVGYADDYVPLIAHQWIDVTGLPKDVYRLCATVNPDGWWVEENGNRANNSFWYDIRMNPAKGALTILAQGRTACMTGA